MGELIPFILYIMAYQHLNRSKRMELAILLQKGYSFREIGTVLGIHPSSISRELKKNSLATGPYDPERAYEKARSRRRYSKYVGMKISKERWLQAYIQKKLEMGWTPEQISGRLKHNHQKTIVSFKTIYKWIYSSRGQAYAEFLPSKRYKPRKRVKPARVIPAFPDLVSIDNRPKIAKIRGRIGDFEGDTLGKPLHTRETLVGVVDRRSRYFLAKKVKYQRRVMKDGFLELFQNIPVASLTLDRGIENIPYGILGIATYFCHPYSAWEKPTIENTFQRLRRYIPKRSDLADFSDDYIAFVVQRMNNTPRKCLGYRTPEEVFTRQKRVLHLGV